LVSNTAYSLPTPAQTRQHGKAPVLSPQEAGQSLNNHPADTIIGKRDRTLPVRDNAVMFLHADHETGVDSHFRRESDRGLFGAQRRCFEGTDAGATNQSVFCLCICLIFYAAARTRWEDTDFIVEAGA
jgi:hypothetical protein